MKPYYEHAGIMIFNGDCREVLKELESESVHCVVTSPPYWGLRDYGTASWEGGSAECDHAPRAQLRGTFDDGMPASLRDKPTQDCPKCGAVRIDQQLGLESTPDEYIASMVAVFREVKRVLRADGTLWLNMGDCYNQGNKGQSGEMNPNYKQASNHGSLSTRRGPMLGSNRNRNHEGMKPKDLVGMPWALAFALRADGWYLRSDIIWSKPNPMPESVTDRPTKAHEYIFLLSKSERYFYDAEAIREKSITNDIRRPYGSEGAWQMDGRPIEQRHGGEPRVPNSYKGSVPGRSGGPGQERRSANDRRPKAWDEDMGSNRTLVAGYPRKIKVPGGWDRGEGAHGTIHRDGRTEAEYQEAEVQEGRNKRTVWEVATQPFPEAHFATFPEDLIKPCILAGCPPGGTVLDPFFGSGTTGLVARANGCKCIGIELNPDYCEIAAKRLSQEVLEFIP